MKIKDYIRDLVKRIFHRNIPQVEDGIFISRREIFYLFESDETTEDELEENLLETLLDGYIVLERYGRRMVRVLEKYEVERIKSNAPDDIPHWVGD